jgi:hypothetical protein
MSFLDSSDLIVLDAAEIRNPQYNQLGTIDVEVNHPEFGWIPFTYDSSDTQSTLNINVLGSLISALNVADYVPVEEGGDNVESSDEITSEVQDIIDGL